MKSKFKILFETTNSSRCLRHFLFRIWKAPFIYLLTHELKFKHINQKLKEKKQPNAVQVAQNIPTTKNAVFSRNEFLSLEGLVPSKK